MTEEEQQQEKVGAPLSLEAISPPQQGDLISGLVIAVAGVGRLNTDGLPDADWPSEIDDVWVTGVGSETGWYVLLSQDCDVVGGSDAEPTVMVAPVMVVDRSEWETIARSYTARLWAYPDVPELDLCKDQGPVVDLAWACPILRGSLASPEVKALRPLTGPQQRRFAMWLANRFARPSFSDDLMRSVINPFQYIHERLVKSFVKTHATGTSKIESRAAAAARRWFIRVEDHHITLVGQATQQTMFDAGFLTGDGDIDETAVTAATRKLEATLVARMQREVPDSGYSVRVQMVDFAQISAAEYLKMSLLTEATAPS